jgi:hypothetical protein
MRLESDLKKTPTLINQHPATDVSPADTSAGDREYRSQ